MSQVLQQLENGTARFVDASTGVTSMTIPLPAATAPANAIADHADTATATTAQIATKQNAILAALRTHAIIATS